MKFNKKKHTYVHKKEEYISVTTLVKKFFKEFDDKNISKYIARSRRKKGEKCTAWDVRREWKAIREAGTEVHEQIETFINSGNECEHPKAKQGVIYYRDLYNKLQKPIVLTEHLVYSEKYKVAGTVDLIIDHEYIEGKRALIIVDWKTNRKFRTSGSKGTHELTEHLRDTSEVVYALQLSLYAAILEDLGHKIYGLRLVHLKEDGYVEYKPEFMNVLAREMLEWQKESVKKKQQKCSEDNKQTN
jgi:hypothetical protein